MLRFPKAPPSSAMQYLSDIVFANSHISAKGDWPSGKACDSSLESPQDRRFNSGIPQLHILFCVFSLFIFYNNSGITQQIGG